MTRQTVRQTGLARRQVLAAGLALGTTGCGYILYPGRRGRSGGHVDIPVLIIDLLWLIPGLVPGAICLIVDFTTGCIYRGGGRAETSSPPSPNDSRVTNVAVELDGEIVATGQVQADRRAQLDWKRPVDETVIRERARVLVQSAGGLAEAQVRALV